MMASGLAAYLESGWNVFDLSVTLLALMGAVLLSIAPKLFIVVIFRPLRSVTGSYYAKTHWSICVSYIIVTYNTSLRLGIFRIGSGSGEGWTFGGAVVC